MTGGYETVSAVVAPRGLAAELFAGYGDLRAACYEDLASCTGRVEFVHSVMLAWV